jgi:hypothetical protein
LTEHVAVVVLSVVVLLTFSEFLLLFYLLSVAVVVWLPELFCLNYAFLLS